MYVRVAKDSWKKQNRLIRSIGKSLVTRCGRLISRSKLRPGVCLADLPRGLAANNLDILYLDDETLEWAKKTGDHEAEATVEFHQDSNGTRLFEGDTVVLVKTLDVKGSSLSAKLGTVVKNIRLVPDNTEQIEGKIEGQTIVILTKYLRKG